MRFSPFVATTAVAGALLLSACAPEVESSIYLTDVLKVGAEGGVLVTPALFRVPQGSEDSCKEGLSGLIERLSALAPTNGKGQCIKKEGDTLAEIETSMVIAAANSVIPESNLFVLQVAPDEVDGGYSLTFRLVAPIEEIIEALAKDSSEMQAELDPTVFTFKLNNDAQRTVRLLANNVFVGGEPGVPEMGSLEIEPRMVTEIRLSDVASVYVERANSYTFATITAD